MLLLLTALDDGYRTINFVSLLRVRRTPFVNVAMNYSSEHSKLQDLQLRRAAAVEERKKIIMLQVNIYGQVDICCSKWLLSEVPYDGHFSTDCSTNMYRSNAKQGKHFPILSPLTQ